MYYRPQVQSITPSSQRLSPADLQGLALDPLSPHGLLPARCPHRHTSSVFTGILEFVYTLLNVQCCI